MSRTTLNTIGLVLTIVGAGLLFFFVTQSGPTRGGTIGLILEQQDEDEAKAFERNSRLSRAGFALIVIGSALQVWSNYVG